MSLLFYDAVIVVILLVFLLLGAHEGCILFALWYDRNPGGAGRRGIRRQGAGS